MFYELISRSSQSFETEIFLRDFTRFLTRSHWSSAGNSGMSLSALQQYSKISLYPKFVSKPKDSWNILMIFQGKARDCTAVFNILWKENKLCINHSFSISIKNLRILPRLLQKFAFFSFQSITVPPQAIRWDAVTEAF